MRRPHLSTGAWLFCGIVTAALIAPAGVYAAVNSHVAIGNLDNATTATVDPEHQLLTTMIDPKNVVHFHAIRTSACHKVYTPPRGKGLVLTNVTLSFGSGVQGNEEYAFLHDRCGVGAQIYDHFETIQKRESQQRTYLTGLPMTGVAVSAADGGIWISAVGYLIPLSEMPPSHLTVNKLAHLPRR